MSTKRIVGAVVVAGVLIFVGLAVFQPSVAVDRLRPITSLSWRSDSLRVGNANGDTTILVSSTKDRSTCRVFKGGGDHDVGDMRAAASQLAVFAFGRGVYFDPDLRWSLWPWEIKEIQLGAPKQLKVKIWQLSDVSATPVSDADIAQRRLSVENSGFDMTYQYEDVSSLKLGNVKCESAKRLAGTVNPHDPSSTIFDKDAINVYYANGCGKECEDAGLSCDADRRFNFVYSIGSETTLLHELGHALLGRQGNVHWGISAMPSNAMRDSSAATRNQFSAGQLVSMNYEASSVANQISPGESAVDCGTDCPSLEFDDMWPDCRPPQAPQPAGNGVDALFDCVECDGGQVERVVKESSFNGTVLARLREALAVKGVAVSATTPPYEANATARKQRRSLRALEVMYLQNKSIDARSAINAAFESQARYRADVREVIVAVWATTR